MRPSMYANADCSRRSSAVQSPKSGGASITRMSKPMRRLTWCGAAGRYNLPKRVALSARPHQHRVRPFFAKGAIVVSLGYLHHCFSHGMPSLLPSILVPGQFLRKNVASAQEVICEQ